jgi:threonine synthase
VATFFSHLECSVPCGAGPYDPRQAHHVCTCGAPLVARYDLTGAKRWPRSSLAGREASLWRYREILPLLESDKGLDRPVTLGEGWTPLVRARRLGPALGIDRLYIKDEALNPCATFKARGMSAAVTRALHVGARVLSLAASGGSGVALSAFAARAGLEARVFMPSDARPAFVDECRMYGARVTLVTGGVTDAARQCAEESRAEGWYEVGGFREPYRLEGKKTLGYELAEQLNWQLPDWIVCPTGGGAALIGIWKAFAEMAALGWIDTVRRPRMVAVQAAGCAPLVRAFGAHTDKAAAWDAPQTVADGLRVPSTAGDVLVLRALRESSGTAVAAGDGEMVAGMTDAARLEGISAGPECGAAVHAVRVLMHDGRITSRDTVVVLNTAAAVRHIDLIRSRSRVS